MKAAWNRNLSEAPEFRTLFLRLTNGFTGDLKYDIGEKVPDDVNTVTVGDPAHIIPKIDGFVTSYAKRLMDDGRQDDIKKWHVERWLDPTRV